MIAVNMLLSTTNPLGDFLRDAGKCVHPKHPYFRIPGNED